MAQAVGDLRASHFSLGSTNQSKIYFKQFLVFKITHSQALKSQAFRKEERIKLNLKEKSQTLEQVILIWAKIDVQNTLYINILEQYNTTFKTHYPNHGVIENAKLNDEKKWDLRKNHFTLGNQDGSKLSVSKVTYDQKQIQPNIQNEQEQWKVKMRAHHHDFKETNAKIMRTFYNEQYQGYNKEDVDQKGLKQKDIQDRAIQLRQSHIILGKESLGMQSTQQQDYAKKNQQSMKNFVIPPQQSHFSLGEGKGDYTTMSQTYLKAQPAAKQEFAEENRQDLRQTHFTLGQDGQGYQSESMSHFRPYSTTKIEYKNNTKQLQANHFNLGDQSYKIKYESNYSMNMKNRTGQEDAQQLRDQRMDRGSNFIVGKDNIQYQSEFGSNFGKPVNGRPATLDQRVMNDLRTSHFNFNDVKNNQFQTTANQSFKPRNGIPNQLDPLQEATLRSHHFQLGQNKRNLISTMHDTHRPLDGKPNELNPLLKANLRKTHFAFS